jgi:DNA-binding HxlR family transcriptional regulator
VPQGALSLGRVGPGDEQRSEVISLRLVGFRVAGDRGCRGSQCRIQVREQGLVVVLALMAQKQVSELVPDGVQLPAGIEGLVVDDQVGGIRPAGLMRMINAQASERHLTWKVLAERLDWLEGEGYVTRRQVDPGETWYWLRPRACRMLAALDALAAWYDEPEGRAHGM